MEAHLKNANGMRERVKDWDNGSKRLGIVIAEVYEDVAKCILAIKKNIQPKCKHPKKMQDVCEGQRYCMNCNMDI